ncbi:MAG: HAD family hydrolase [Gammaproteobacteria bacterium]|jgi:HAD superfamily hydrolase (TIGR01509 family)|nr:HAD family hydrolase [Gammaproteobacteria bacterium]MBT5825270.1 HAD family hydrolase [Gammaproteobacteria bacterium]MBT5966791.1 HAD family hydrolase [Gammaproteobacteria bacterium]MBT6576614.1 HAD family hydrolase [Gammaproteobacteria bacterium]
MLKALFLDMDETLCDTMSANEQAKSQMGLYVEKQFGQQLTVTLDGEAFASDYVHGIYREWSPSQRERYMPIIEQQSEGAYRIQLIRDLLARCGIDNVEEAEAIFIQQKFDKDRIAAFDFYPGIAEFLQTARQLFTLVVITNGPVYSQIPKIERVKLADYVDHIIIGGQEPEQKPAVSIFEKALKLAACEAHEAIQVGDSLHSDIQGANNSGITSVWVQHQQPLDAELGINPSHTVLTPAEIPALIRDIHGK